MREIKILVLLLLLLPAVFAVPGIPHQFYGYVNFTNAPAPDGIVIEARIDGKTVASTITLNGRYGYKPKLFFVTDPNNNRAGKTINFYINGVDTGVTATFKNGSTTKIDFNIEGIVSEMNLNEDQTLTNENVFVSKDSPAIINIGDLLTVSITSTEGTTAKIEKIQKLEDATVADVYGIPSGQNLLNAFEIKISGDVNIIVTMYYNDSGINESSIKPYKFDGTSWQPIAEENIIEINTNANYVKFRINPETPYALFGAKATPSPTPATATTWTAGGAPGAAPREKIEETPTEEVEETPELTPEEMPEETPEEEVSKKTPSEEEAPKETKEEVAEEAKPTAPEGTPTTKAPVATPTMPTGFFGLGVAGDIIGGILILIIIAGTIAYIHFSRKNR